jgi:hypothetical protein
MMIRKLAVIGLVFCFMVPFTAQAQSPIAAMAKAKSDSSWCVVLPQACQLGKEIVKALGRFRRGAKNFGAEPAPAVPAD